MVAAVTVAAVLLAVMLGVSDSPNASAVLLGTRAAHPRAVRIFTFAFHAAGALAGGTGVALTIATLLHLPPSRLGPAFLAGAVAAVVLTAAAARVGLPVSASFALVGGLAGAGLVAGGVGALAWGGFRGVRPFGIAGTLVAMVVSPALGFGAAALTRTAAADGLRRATVRVLHPIRAGIWGTAALVALSDGTNDGQKAMGLVAAVLVSAGTTTRFEIPWWLRATVAVALGAGAALGGRRIVRRVGRGYYPEHTVDGLAVQTGAAAIILGAAAIGAPVSTSNVVASAVIGAGASRHPRHVRWRAVAATAWAWALTVPAAALVGAVVYPIAKAAA